MFIYLAPAEMGVTPGCLSFVTDSPAINGALLLSSVHNHCELTSDIERKTDDWDQAGLRG